MSESLIVYMSKKENPDELIGFQVKGNIKLIIGLSNGEAYLDILKRHGVDLTEDPTNELVAGNIDNVDDVEQLANDSRDFYVYMGFECSPVKTKTYEEWNELLNDV